MKNKATLLGRSNQQLTTLFHEKECDENKARGKSKQTNKT
jgi:hypothetical protein